MNKELEKVLDSYLSRETRGLLKEGVVSISKSANETGAVDVLNNCLIELRRINHEETKGMIVGALLGECTLGIQRIIASSHATLCSQRITEEAMSNPNTLLALLKELGE